MGAENYPPQSHEPIRLAGIYPTPFALPSAPEPPRTLRTRMWDHDANEEARYLHDGKRLAVSWAWFWFQWTFGLGFDLHPEEDREHRASGWLSLGPICLGLDVKRATR